MSDTTKHYEGRIEYWGTSLVIPGKTFKRVSRAVCAGVAGNLGSTSNDCADIPTELLEAAGITEDTDDDTAFEFSAEWGEANARRVAACWNACLGAQTESLEAGLTIGRLAHDLEQLTDMLPDLIACAERGKVIGPLAVAEARGRLHNAARTLELLQPAAQETGEGSTDG